MADEKLQSSWEYSIQNNFEYSKRTYMLVYRSQTTQERRINVISQCRKPYPGEGTYGTCTHALDIQPTNAKFILDTGEDVVLIQTSWDAPLTIGTLEYGCCAGPDTVRFYDQGRYDQAISDFTRVLEINPKLGNVYYNRGTVYWIKKEYGNAISDFNRAIEINPRDSDIYIGRGGVYIDKGLYDQAISDFNKAIELDPKPVEAYFNRGVAYAKKGQLDHAIPDFNRTLEMDPRHAGGFSSRGSTYYQKGLYDQAISDFNKALEINPNYAGAYHNRGKTYYFKKEYDKSWEDIKKAQDLGYKIPPGFLDDLRKASGRQN